MAPMPDVTIHVEGLADLDRAFRQVGDDLAHELGAGFVPKAQYRGQGGVPFVVGRVRFVAERARFTTHGMDDGE